MASAATPLVADELALLPHALGAIPDGRQRPGRRHPLFSLLGLVVLGLLGLLATCRSRSAISRDARSYRGVPASGNLPDVRNRAPRLIQKGAPRPRPFSTHELATGQAGKTFAGATSGAASRAVSRMPGATA
jgi:hypothetical protein